MEDKETNDKTEPDGSIEMVDQTVTFDIIERSKYVHDFRSAITYLKDRCNDKAANVTKNGLNILQACIISGRYELFSVFVEIGWWNVLSSHVVDAGPNCYRGKTAKQIAEMKPHRNCLENFNSAHEWEQNLSPLMKACRSEDLEEVKRLLEIDSDNRFALDINGGNALFWAVMTGSPELLEIMISKGLDPTVLNYDKENLLHIACRVGQTKLLPTLLKPCYKLDLTQKDQDYKTAVDRAVTNGNKEILEEFAKHEIYPKPHHLLMCIDNGRLALLDYLVEKMQMSVLVEDEMGLSLLLRACIGNHTSIVKYLLEKQVNTLDMEKNTGRNLLHIICNNGNAELLRVVIPKLKEEKTLDTLINEQDYHSLEDLFFLLLQGENNWTKIEVSRTDVPAFLAKIDRKQIDAVHFPCINRTLSHEGTMPLVDEIDEKIKSLNLNDEQVPDMTPLHIAALKVQYIRFGYTEMAKVLIENGCDVNVKDCFGNTAAILAASNGNLDLVTSLKIADADLKVKNNEGKGINDVAIENGHVAIVNFTNGRDFLEITKAFTDHPIAQLKESLSTNSIEVAGENEESRKGHVVQSLKDFYNEINVLLKQLGPAEESEELANELAERNEDREIEVITVDMQTAVPSPITVFGYEPAVSDDLDMFEI